LESDKELERKNLSVQKEVKMKKSFWGFVLLFFIFYFTANGAMAETDIIPGGPWITENQKVNYEALHSYDELVKALKQIEKAAKGLVELEVIGQTNLGRDIYLAKVGDPDNTPVMFQTQQHGNEPIGTESALQVIKFLSTGSAKAQQILEALYVLIIVRANPDGAELWQRYDYDPEAVNYQACGLYAGTGVGWDINRFHWIDWTESPSYNCSNPDYNYATNPVPESQAIIDAFLVYEPIWFVDVHGQATYVTFEGENVTSSMLWPTNPDASAAAVQLSQQLCVIMMDQMYQYGYATVTRYPGGTYQGIARNAYGIAGAGSVLVEMKGGIGQKSVGMLVKHAVEQMTAILEATADESLYDTDPARVDELPTERIFYYKDLPPPHGEDVEPE